MDGAALPPGARPGGQEVRESLPIQLRKLLQLNRVNPALPKLALGDVGLRSAQRFSNFNLGEPRLNTRLAEAYQHVLVTGSVSRAPALRVLHNESTVYPIPEYPNMGYSAIT